MVKFCNVLPGGSGPFNSNSIICSMRISLANFFSKVFCRVKADEVEMDGYNRAATKEISILFMIL